MNSADLVSDPAELTVLYRGPLSSCNYGCGYCPFAKRVETPEERAADAAALARLMDWVANVGERRIVRVFFTPWGEALHHARYRQAIVELSRMPHVRQVAVQTNLAGSVAWLARADVAAVAIWATYHPSQVRRERFLARSAAVQDLGVAHSVGVVGARNAIEEIAAMRAQLPPEIPMWVNAFSMRGGAVDPGYYTAADIARLHAVDPLFEVGLAPLVTAGRSCRTGESVISVDGAGGVRRCHFDHRVLGNLWRDELDSILAARPCRRPTCDCHIGYVHLSDLRAERVYGEGLLARIPLASQRAPEQAQLLLARARLLQSPAAPSGVTTAELSAEAPAHRH